MSSHPGQAPARTNTDAVIVALLELGGDDHRWVYVNLIQEFIFDEVGKINVRYTLDFLEDEYGAVEYLPGSKAARIVDLTDYEAGNRHYGEKYPFPAERGE